MTEQVKPPVNPRLAKMDQCKSGRPKAVVAQELANERATLEKLHLLVNEHCRKREKSVNRVENWKQQQRATNPGISIDMEDCPFEVIPADVDLVEVHRRQHYVIAALEDELEGREEK